MFQRFFVTSHFAAQPLLFVYLLINGAIESELYLSPLSAIQKCKIQSVLNICMLNQDHFKEKLICHAFFQRGNCFQNDQTDFFLPFFGLYLQQDRKCQS